MTVYGVTPTGFVAKPLTVCQAELKALVLGTIDPGLDVSDDQPLGQLLGIFAAREAALWEVAAVCYAATSRDDAEDALLDNIGGLTGTTRLGPTPSTVPCDATFSAAGFYVAGSLAAYIAGAPAQQWTNKVGITVPTTGDGGGPIGPSNLYTAHGVLWQSTTDGPIYGEALEAANFLLGHAGSLSVPVPVAGWATVADVAEVALGQLLEVDAAYRVRQRAELAAPGACTIPAIEAAIVAAFAAMGLPVSVQMVENTGWTTDGNGLPPKSFMAVVYDGVSPPTATNDPIIEAAIEQNRPGGMLAYGTYTPTVPYVSPAGESIVVPFTRPTPVPIYLAFTVAVAAGATTAQKNAIQAAIAVALSAATQGEPFTMYGATVTPTAGAETTFAPGKDAVLSILRGLVQAQAGVLDVPAFTMGKTYPATGTANLSFTLSQIAKLDPGGTDGTHPYVTVTFTTFTP